MMMTRTSLQPRVPRRSPLLGAALALVLLGAPGCSKEEVVHGLTEFEANEIVYVLEEGGIKAAKEKEEGGRVIMYKVIVGGGEANAARRVLVDNQLPRPKPMTMDKVYDPANKGLIPTATEEKAAYVMALQGEIIQKLKTIPGVVEAHVTIVKPERDVVRDLMEKPPPATASVTVLYNMVEGKMPFRMEDVQRLVAGSVEGMDWQNVTVVANVNRPAASRMMGGRADDDKDEIDTSRMPKFIGVAVADEANKKKLMTLSMGAGVTIGIAMLAFILMLASFMTTKRKLTQLTSELTSIKKARKAEAAAPPA